MRVVFSGPKFILNNQDICDDIDALPAAGCHVDKIVIGEVHCVPHCGGNFRPLYKELRDHLCAFVNVPMYATTATLQEHHQKEVQDTLPYDKDSTLASQSRIEGKPVQWVNLVRTLQREASFAHSLEPHKVKSTRRARSSPMELR
jgi:superfamily II DNA helicase RecQ